MSLSDDNRAQMRNSSHKPSSTSQSISIFPVPDAAIFHQPQRTQETKSSGSSSGSKRKREDIDDERSSTSRRLAPLRPSSTSDFSDTLKTQIRVEYDNKCWHCGASPADVCHVIGNRDNTFNLALKEGLIDIPNKKHPHNAIALCGTCHRNFDDLENPCFIFLPTDIEYFIMYEKQDRIRRLEIGRRGGSLPARTCPTAQSYQEHQIQIGVDDVASGGLYTRIVLDDFLPKYPGRPPFVPGLSEYGAIKSWSGSPMAALQRAVAMMRRLNLKGIPRHIRESMRALQDIYSEPLSLETIDDETQVHNSIDDVQDERFDDARSRGGALPDQISYRPDANHRNETGRFFESGNGKSGDGEKNATEAKLFMPSKQLFTEQKSDEENLDPSPPKTKAEYLQKASIDFDCSWRWGPAATSEDVIKFFRTVMARKRILRVLGSD